MVRPDLRPDPFMVAILIAAVVGTLLPVGGAGVGAFDWGTKSAIGLLFFLYGARLAPREALEGLKHWRLHLIILAFTYLVFPLAGLGIGYLPQWLLPHELYLGVLFLCLVPSTVQSSISFTSIARGNVAGAVVSATTSNLLGVLLTPLLTLTLIGGGGAMVIRSTTVVDIVMQLLVPFVVGQLTRRWTAEIVHRNRSWLKYVDQTVIVLVVYGAFAAGRREGMWAQVILSAISVLVVLCALLVGIMLWLTGLAARKLGFTRADQIAIQFCGTKKSLASGAPMASVLFAGHPLGLMVLPLMIFHQLQLLACTVLAARYARQSPPGQA